MKRFLSCMGLPVVFLALASLGAAAEEAAIAGTAAAKRDVQGTAASKEAAGAAMSEKRRRTERGKEKSGRRPPRAASVKQAKAAETTGQKSEAKESESSSAPRHREAQEAAVHDRRRPGRHLRSPANDGSDACAARNGATSKCSRGGTWRQGQSGRRVGNLDTEKIDKSIADLQRDQALSRLALQRGRQPIGSVAGHGLRWIWPPPSGASERRARLELLPQRRSAAVRADPRLSTSNCRRTLSPMSRKSCGNWKRCIRPTTWSRKPKRSF